MQPQFEPAHLVGDAELPLERVGLEYCRAASGHLQDLDIAAPVVVVHTQAVIGNKETQLVTRVPEAFICIADVLRCSVGLRTR